MRNVVIISDTHCGCKLGLCTAPVQLDEGGTYAPSPMQKTVAKRWSQFWAEWVPLVTKNEPYIIVHNGDIIDGVHHGATTPITGNITDQRSIAFAAMEPVVSNPKCKGYYQIRGTEVHVGKSGQEEEALAAQLGAIPDETGNHSRYEMWMDLEGHLIHFTHHIGQTHSAAYESTAVHKELVEAYTEAGRWQEKPPDVVVRSHRHRDYEVRLPAESGRALSIVTAGWQLKTPHVYRLALGKGSTPQIGGRLLRIHKDIGLYSDAKIWKMDRPKTVVA